MMNPAIKRTFCGLGAGALVIGLVLYCPLRAIMPVVLAVSALAQMEFYAMAKRKYGPVAWFGLAMGALWIAWTGFAGFGKGSLGATLCFVPFVVLSLLLLCTIVLFSSRYSNPVGSIAVTMAGFLYVPFLMSFFLMFVQLTAEGWWGYSVSGEDRWLSRAGLYTLFALIAIAKFSDTGGFAFGLAFGKHRMCPSISPKKTWEGLLGSVLFASATAAAMLALARRFGWGEDVEVWNAITYPAALCGGAVLALAATAGDLVESRFKREFEVKDSSSFMPARMGGVLDMLDSILFIVPPALCAVFAHMVL